MRTMYDLNKEENEAIVKIVDRAYKMKLIGKPAKFSSLMDVSVAHAEFNLRLNEFLIADDFNFIHDFCGIQNCIDRASATMGHDFIPRFAAHAA